MKLICFLSLFVFTIVISCKQQPGHHNLAMDVITEGIAKEHVKNFQIKLKSSLDTSDSRCVWFPINELTQFLAAAKTRDPQIDGVRFYFATYGEMPDSEYSNKNTLILVLTKREDKDPKHIHHKDIYTDTILEPTLVTTNISPANQGELCPANCDGADLLELKP